MRHAPIWQHLCSVMEQFNWNYEATKSQHFTVYCDGICGSVILRARWRCFAYNLKCRWIPVGGKIGLLPPSTTRPQKQQKNRKVITWLDNNRLPPQCYRMSSHIIILQSFLHAIELSLFIRPTLIYFNCHPYLKLTISTVYPLGYC